MPTLTIDIVSDIACPWCAIGYARLEQAIKELAPTFDFSVEWHAFELNPDHTGPGEAILPALARKYGRTEEEMRSNQEQMMATAKELGLNFSSLQERFTCNTFDAHRLVKWAAGHGQQTAMKLALFEAYFGQGEDVSNPQVLEQCATELGLDGAEAQTMLKSDEYKQAVRDDEAKYQNAGVNAVPAFIVNNKYLISGAQEASTFVQAFQDIAAESA